ncbi:MAG: Fic/DOC family N-terminal domain-containing protein [Mycobacteriales bacterium]
MHRDNAAPGQHVHMVRAERGYYAFLPPPLPPPLVFDAGLVNALSAADRAVGTLTGIGHTLSSAHLLAHALVRREAVLSSRIEGTQATLSELALFEVEPGADTGGSAHLASCWIRPPMPLRQRSGCGNA